MDQQRQVENNISHGNTDLHLKFLQGRKPVLFVGMGRLELEMNAGRYFKDISITQKEASFPFAHSMVIPEGAVQREILGIDQRRYVLQAILIKDNGVDLDMLI